jgi:hypothetical protein
MISPTLSIEYAQVTQQMFKLYYSNFYFKSKCLKLNFKSTLVVSLYIKYPSDLEIHFFFLLK